MSESVSNPFLQQISAVDTAESLSRTIHGILSSSSIFIAVESATELCILFTPDNGKQYGALISFSIADGHLLTKVSKRSIYQTMYLGGCFTFDADAFVQSASLLSKSSANQDSLWIAEDNLTENAEALITAAAQFANVILSYC